MWMPITLGIGAISAMRWVSSMKTARAGALNDGWLMLGAEGIASNNERAT